jgi:hypothetical protein
LDSIRLPLRARRNARIDRDTHGAERRFVEDEDDDEYEDDETGVA